MVLSSPRSRRAVVPVVAGALLATFAATAGAAQPPVGLGTDAAFAVLGGSAVTNTGPSVINGDLGIGPGTSITGFPPGLVNGVVHATDAVATQAQADLTVAYDDAAGRTPPAVLPPDLGGLFLTPGVYSRASSLLLTGDVTLDAQGDPNAVFIIQIGSSLTTASASRVVLTNGAQACNVFWKVGSSATLGTDTSFVGNILALQSISMTTRARLRGRALARNGAVTLDTNVITRADCAPGTTPVDSTTPGSGATPGDGTTTPGGTVPPPTGKSAPGRRRASQLQQGSTFVRITPPDVARTITRHGTNRCVRSDFRAEVGGRSIRSVTFTLDGRSIGTLRGRAPVAVLIHSLPGVHRLRARVTFTDATPARTVSFAFRTCSEDVARAIREPGFTG